MERDPGSFGRCIYKSSLYRNPQTRLPCGAVLVRGCERFDCGVAHVVEQSKLSDSDSCQVDDSYREATVQSLFFFELLQRTEDRHSEFSAHCMNLYILQ